MRKRRLVSSLAVAAGLGIGGLAGVILGGPGVSAAQTTTTVPEAGDPAPTTPAAPDAPADRPSGEDKDCPNMGGESDGTGSGARGPSTDATAAFHRGPRGGGAIRTT
jgi:hypothetical protein